MRFALVSPEVRLGTGASLTSQWGRESFGYARREEGASDTREGDSQT